MPDTKSPLTRRELIDHLAPLIWQERQREAEHYAALHKQTRPPWYFLNVNHPTIKRLYLRYLQKSLDGSALVAPVSDLDRVKFELMAPDTFARERLGWWSPAPAEHIDYAIDAAAWDRCASDETKPEGKTAYGVKFAADGSAVCLCGAVLPKAGPARVSMIELQPGGRGLAWLSGWLNERYRKASCVVIDGRGGADVLVDRIRETWRAKNAVIRPSARDVVAAAGLLVNCVNEGSLTWYRPQQALRESAVTATKRPISGGYGFGGENSLPIEACALALWGAKTSRRDPTRNMRIG